ncbi:MAG: hypothetical protein U9N80_07590 [Chloroflexota bacterium]|nr:hypothetical protein [Chloroflexota bacterium]
MKNQGIEVTTKVIGETDLSLQMMPVWVVVDVETITAKEIIARAVETQVKKLLSSKPKIDLKKARRILVRQYMSQDDVDTHGVKSGTKHSPGEISVEAWEPEFDVGVEIERALEAFEGGRMVMFVDDQQMHEMGEEVTITDDTKVKFIRLTPLVGG